MLRAIILLALDILLKRKLFFSFFWARRISNSHVRTFQGYWTEVDKKKRSQMFSWNAKYQIWSKKIKKKKNELRFKFIYAIFISIKGKHRHKWYYAIIFLIVQFLMESVVTLALQILNWFLFFLFSLPLVSHANIFTFNSQLISSFRMISFCTFKCLIFDWNRMELVNYNAFFCCCFKREMQLCRATKAKHKVCAKERERQKCF